MMKRLVSSANKRILDPIFLSISLTYNNNNKWPTIEPCGARAIMKTHSEKLPGSTTR